LNKPDFDVKRTAVIETGQSQEISHSVTNANVNIIADKKNQVMIETDNEQEGLLILSDNYYPGWSATIDGNPVEILRANHTMRAVGVPAGAHVVSFRFAPKIFRASITISVVSSFIVFLALIFLRRSEKA